MRKIVLALLFPCFCLFSFSQHTFVNKWITGVPFELHNILETGNGNFIAADFSQLPGWGYAQPVMVRLSPTGDVEWGHRYDGGSFSIFRNVTETSDGGLIAIGQYDMEFVDGASKMLVVRTDSTGNVLWSRGYRNMMSNSGGTHILPVLGGYLIGGKVNSPGNGIQATVLKIDDLGDIVWSKTYVREGTSNYRITGLVATPDGGLLGTGNDFLIRADANGDTLWVRETGFGIRDVEITPSGNYILVGAAQNELSGPAHWDAVMVMIDDSGNYIWGKSYGAEFPDMGIAVEVKSNGNLMMMSYSENPVYGDKQTVFTQTDPNGATIWTRTYEGSMETEMLLTSDGGLMSLIDTFLIKTDGNGIAADCKGESNIPLTEGIYWDTSLPPIELEIEAGVYDDSATFVALPFTSVTEQVCMKVGIENPDLDPVSLAVFPNPGNGLFTVSLKGRVRGEGSLQIFDLNGKQVWKASEPVFENEFRDQIDLRMLPEGLYFCRFQSEYQQITQRVLLMK